MPEVSVIIPLHNKGPYVAQTLDSIKHQVLTDWEALVIENGSTDNGPEVVAGISLRDSRIRLIMAPEEVRGPCAARNLGIKDATGEWVLFLDADDWIEPNHLAALSAAGRLVSADVVAGGWKEFIDGNDADFQVREGPSMEDTAESVVGRCLASAPWAVHAALLRRDWLTYERRWPMEMERLPSEDSVFWFRILHGARLAVSRSNGAIYRKETTGHRDCHGETERWAQAVLEVIRLNEEWLIGNDKKPGHDQAACVIRTLEQLYVRCNEAGHREIAERVLIEAERWLARTSLYSPGLALRRLLGIRGFGQLRRSSQIISGKG